MSDQNHIWGARLSRAGALRNRRSGIMCGIFCLQLALAAAAYAAPVVTNVRGTQRFGTRQVDVYYDLSERATVSLSVSVDGGATWTVPVANVSQSVGPSVSAGRGKHILWDAGADWPGQVSSAVRFKVTAYGTDLEGDYLVIDLSGGPSASSYPVTYLTAVPPGGWTDEHKTTKLVMRRIPKTAPGTFTMGSPVGELGRDSNETQCQVTLTKDYYMGVFEVTQRQWELVMGNKPSYFNNASYYASRPVERVSYYDIRENAGSNSAISPNWPQSSAVGSSSFVGKLRAKTGLATLDLPTESQWEYACRAGTTTALNSGKNLTNTGSCPNMSEVGRYWYNGGSGYSQGGDTSAGTAKAGSFVPNQWGLYDMHGNVWEWCLDWYGTYLGSVQDPAGAASGSFRVIRGGSWYIHAWYCRSAGRIFSYPDNWNNDVGFRLSRTLP